LRKHRPAPQVRELVPVPQLGLELLPVLVLQLLAWAQVLLRRQVQPLVVCP
jgi:hypothetical protein